MFLGIEPHEKSSLAFPVLGLELGRHADWLLLTTVHLFKKVMTA